MLQRIGEARIEMSDAAAWAQMERVHQVAALQGAVERRL